MRSTPRNCGWMKACQRRSVSAIWRRWRGKRCRHTSKPRAPTARAVLKSGPIPAWTSCSSPSITKNTRPAPCRPGSTWPRMTAAAQRRNCRVTAARRRFLLCSSPKAACGNFTCCCRSIAPGRPPKPQRRAASPSWVGCLPPSPESRPLTGSPRRSQTCFTCAPMMPRPPVRAA